MKKIILLCAAGMSTSMLVTKMREEAVKIGYDCEINAYPMSEAAAVGKDADIILLGPQVRFNLNKVRGLCPNAVVEAIDMRAYGKIDGKAVVEFAKSKIGD